MLFPTAVFAVFFAIVFAGHWLLPERSLARKVFLLASSLVFYGWWSWKFALMLLASALLNHAAACAIARSASPRARRGWLAAGATGNLAVLAVFKYAGFFFSQCFLPLAFPVCRAAGATETLLSLTETVFPVLETIVLPVGISFYTFQALSYVIDVHRGACAPAPSALDFANYLAFFPQLVAGPIVRASVLLPQMAVLPARDTKLDTGRAGCLVLAGLLKKTVLANFLAMRLADPFFNDPAAYGSLDAVFGVLAYALQIYCDFSAYSDIATGCALLLGFHFPDNFHAPYFARSLQDFWRRWHISLSSWLRDYLYIPLGGNRKGKLRTYANLMATMLLGGLWHGANWAFVLWGAIHGAGLALERLLLPRPAKGEAAAAPGALARFVLAPAQYLLTMLVVCLAWIFFRSGSLEGLATVREVFRALFSGASGAFPLVEGAGQTALVLGVFAAAFALQLLDGERPRALWNAANRLPALWQGVAAAVLLTIVLGLGPEGVAPFIYFQF